MRQSGSRFGMWQRSTRCRFEVADTRFGRSSDWKLFHVRRAKTMHNKSYKHYIRKVWSNSYGSEIRIGKDTMETMDMVVYHMFDRIARRSKRKKTITRKGVVGACRGVIPGVLGTIAVDAANQAMRGREYFFPESLMYRYLKEGQLGEDMSYAERVSRDAAAVLAAVLDELTGYVLSKAVDRLPPRFPVLQPVDVMSAIEEDNELRDFIRLPQGPAAGGGGGGGGVGGGGGGGGGGSPRDVIISSAQDMQEFLDRYEATIQQIFQSEYTKRRFVMSFHPDKCIGSTEAVRQLFVRLGKTVQLNIEGTVACGTIFQKFSDTYDIA